MNKVSRSKIIRINYNKHKSETEQVNPKPRPNGKTFSLAINRALKALFRALHPVIVFVELRENINRKIICIPIFFS